MSGYVSDEVKKQQSYHYYNNTNLYVSFTKKALKEYQIRPLTQIALHEL